MQRRKLIGKEALFVILGIKRFKDDEEKLARFIQNHVLRLLKMDMVAVLTELERQEGKCYSRDDDWMERYIFISGPDWCLIISNQTALQNAPSIITCRIINSM